MHTRVSVQKKSESSTSYFTKIFGCLCKNRDTGSDDLEDSDEHLFSDVEPLPYEDEEKNSNNSIQGLLDNIQIDLSTINKYLEFAFENRPKFSYTAYVLWADYFVQQADLLQKNLSCLVSDSFAPFSELDLIQLLAREKGILIQFLKQEEVKLANYEALYDLNLTPERYKIYENEWTKTKNIKESTAEFIYYLEKAVELIQIYNDKLAELQKLINRGNKVQVLHSIDDQSRKIAPLRM